MNGHRIVTSDGTGTGVTWQMCSCGEKFFTMDALRNHVKRQSALAEDFNGFGAAIRTVRHDERNRIHLYVMSRLGHCDDCDKVQAYESGGDPADESCTCAFGVVEGLFAEYAEGER